MDTYLTERRRLLEYYNPTTTYNKKEAHGTRLRANGLPRLINNASPKTLTPKPAPSYSQLLRTRGSAA